MNYTPFRYMAWAKAHQGVASHPLHQSGMPAPTLALLGVDGSSVAVAGSRDLAPRLAAAVAARYGVPEECVLPTCGTHHANLLAAMALAGPGTKVLVETPTYEDLPGVFRLVGAEVLPFRRREEDSWRLPLDVVVGGLDDGATVVVTANLHNPTGAMLLPSDLAALEGAVRDRGATLVLDEVYHDFLEVPFGTAFRPETPFVITSSLTKAYGLGDLRLGWAMAQPEVVRRMREVNDFGVVNMPAPTASIALAAWDALPDLLERNRALASRNRRIVAAWVRERTDVHWVAPTAGITGFLRVPALQGRDDVSWCADLLARTGVGVVPGTMFDEPGSLRVSWGMDTETLREGLSRLGEALDGLGAP